MGVYPIPLPKDSASLSSTAKPSHRTAPHKRSGCMSAICGPSARVVCNSAVYKDKGEAANRGGLPTLRALFFFEATLQSAVAIPAAPKLRRESQPPLCEPGLMGLTSRQVRFWATN